MEAVIDRSRPGRRLFDSDALLIIQEGDIVNLSCYGRWTLESLKLAEKFGVNRVYLTRDAFGQKKSIRFLLDLPDLRAVHIVVGHPVDMTAVSGLTKLEYLGIRGNDVEDLEGRRTPPIDFTPLVCLKEANIEFCRPFESILRCGALESLWLWNSRYYFPISDLDFSGLQSLKKLQMTEWRKLKHLDLTALKRLECLILEAIPMLREGGVTLHPKAKVRSFTMGRCGAYRIDWNRMGNDLVELELQGGLRFPIEDILQAPYLRKFSTNGVRKFPPLQFLLQLKELHFFDWFASPPGPKFSKEDREVMAQIKARDGLTAKDRR